MRCDFWASFLAHTFASPCFGHEPKIKVATIMSVGSKFPTWSIVENLIINALVVNVAVRFILWVCTWDPKTKCILT